MSDTKRTQDLAEQNRDGEDMAALLDAVNASARAEFRAEWEKKAPTFAEAFTATDQEAHAERGLLPLGTLPKWPKGPKHGHGWGEKMNRLLSGGLAPGDVLGIVAARAKSGKTSYLAQLADGLALRTHEEIHKEGSTAPLTPVLWLSEMSARDLSWRTLARWTKIAASEFRAGNKTKEAMEHLSGGKLGLARQYMRRLDPAALTCGVVDAIQPILEYWERDLQSEHPGRDVWPIVVVDPIQRWQDPAESGEVAALNELVETLGEAAAKHGWIVLLTSDTNKESARATQDKQTTTKGTTHERAAGLARGSYKLFHLCTAVLALEPVEHTNKVNVSVSAFRWGASGHDDGRTTVTYQWDGASGRWAEQ